MWTSNKGYISKPIYYLPSWGKAIAKHSSVQKQWVSLIGTRHPA